MVFVFALILITACIALSYMDWTYFRLPDVLTLPLIAIGLLQAWVLTREIVPNIIGVVVGYCVFVGIELAFKYIRKKDGLGRGDAKLLACGGAWCGWAGLPYIVLIASAAGLLSLILPTLRKKSESGHLPFGPFLCFAILLTWAAPHMLNYPLG